MCVCIYNGLWFVLVFVFLKVSKLFTDRNVGQQTDRDEEKEESETVTPGFKKAKKMEIVGFEDRDEMEDAIKDWMKAVLETYLPTDVFNDENQGFFFKL